jgi:NAD(P)-dependent dehydrogenase (short-subunit alcohol dehydrogenase family)
MRFNIVATSSVAGKYGAPLRTGYSAAKHALHGYFDSLRLELAPFNVSVSLIVLGAVKTDISKSALKGDGTSFNEMDPLQAGAPACEELLDDLFAQLATEKREVVVGRGIEIDALTLLREDPDRFHAMLTEITMKAIFE